MARSRRKTNVPGQNAILAALPASESARLKESLEPVSLGLKEVVYEANRPIRHVYFPISGVISLVVVMDDRQGVECATVGSEGMVGMPLFLGSQTCPYRSFSQVPGDALRMTAEQFQEELGRDGALHETLQLYNQGLMTQMAYSVACNRLHSIEERMCRWLLMTRDRVSSDSFPLTQEFLAQMLGVRRPSVSVVAGVLQKADLIAYARGRVVILNPKGLEQASCECYRVVQEEYERLLG